jgi:hypothetical protein
MRAESIWRQKANNAEKWVGLFIAKEAKVLRAF